jgi:putative ABC transport system substrate-binding protein
MIRRIFVFSCLLLAVFLPAVSGAQQAAKAARIGYLHGGSKLDFTDEAFQQALRGFGYVIGKNVVLEYRYGGGKIDRLPELAADLVRTNVNIIVAVSDAGARAAKNATKAIPVVMVGVGTDPAEAGLVASLGRPGGNVTGVTLIAIEIAGRRLQLFKEAVSKAVRVTVLYDPANRGKVAEAKEVQSVSGPLELNVE